MSLKNKTSVDLDNRKSVYIVSPNHCLCYYEKHQHIGYRYRKSHPNNRLKHVQPRINEIHLLKQRTHQSRVWEIEWLALSTKINNKMILTETFIWSNLIPTHLAFRLCPAFNGCRSPFL